MMTKYCNCEILRQHFVLEHLDVDLEVVMEVFWLQWKVITHIINSCIQYLFVFVNFIVFIFVKNLKRI